MKRLDPNKLDVPRIADGVREGRYDRREMHAIMGAFASVWPRSRSSGGGLARRTPR